MQHEKKQKAQKRTGVGRRKEMTRTHRKGVGEITGKAQERWRKRRTKKKTKKRG